MKKCGDCKPTFASRLTKRVTILEDSATTDEYNQPIGETVVCTVWAGVFPLRGREYYAASREGADITTRIEMRYRTDVNRTMYARCDGVDFEILHIIDPEFKHRELHLMCKERQ